MKAISFLFVLFIVAGCQTPPPIPVDTTVLEAPPIPSFPKTDEEALKNFGLGKEQLGYVLFDARQNKVVSSHNASQAFIPASVSKIPSTLLALQQLGPNFRFKTTLGYTGKIEKGRLEGNLYLKGTGDPLLTAAEIMNLAQALVRSGVREMSGSFFYDDISLPFSFQIDETFESDKAYNAGVSALSAEFNRRQLSVKKVGNKLQAYLLPPTDDVSLNLTASGTSEHLDYRRDGNKETWGISSGVSEGIKSLPVKQTSRFTAGLFKSLAALSGVALPDPQPAKYPASAKTLITEESAPLLELVEKELEFSNNVVAELVYLSAMKQLLHTNLESARMADALVRFWKEQGKGTNWQNYHPENGSGGSSKARMTPEQALAFIRWADQKSFGGRSYLSLLPISGWKGSLAERLTDPALAFRVWAKTGSMDYATGLAGYLFSRSGARYYFSIFVLDKNLRTERDGVLVETAAMRQKASDWLKKARGLQDALVTRWVLEDKK